MQNIKITKKNRKANATQQLRAWMNILYKYFEKSNTVAKFPGQNDYILTTLIQTLNSKRIQFMLSLKAFQCKQSEFGIPILNGNVSQSIR